MYLEQEDDLSLVTGVVEADGGAHGLAERLLVHPTDVPALQGHEVDGVEQPTLRLRKRRRKARSGAGRGQTRTRAGAPRGHQAPNISRTIGFASPLGHGKQRSGVQPMYGIRCYHVCRLWWALCGYTYDVLAHAGGNRSLADARPPPDGDAAVALRREAQQAHHLTSTTNMKRGESKDWRGRGQHCCRDRRVLGSRLLAESLYPICKLL